MPQDHLARLILRALDEVDLSPLYRTYSHKGGSPYDPKRLLATVLFGMTDGVRGGADLQEHCLYDERYRFLMGGQEPDDRTFGRFLHRLDPLAEGIFREVLRLARSLKAARADEVAVDGCKVPGACSFWRAVSGEPSDPDARLQNSHGRRLVGYNAQVAVDVSSGPGIIVGALVLPDQNDWQALAPTLEAVKAQYGELPDRVLADSGYESHQGIAAVEEMGVDTGVCPKTAPARQIRENAAGVLCCPAGKPMVKTGVEAQKGGGVRDVYRPQGGCRGCPLAGSCAFRGKRLHVAEGADPAAKARNRDRWHSQAFSGAAKRRRKVETPFAHLRRHDGFDRFRRKGRAKAQSELLLWCVSYNLRKLRKALEELIGSLGFRLCSPLRQLLALGRAGPRGRRPPTPSSA